MTSIVNIAIIGGGLIGPRHAASVLKTLSANLVALVDPAPHGPETAASLNTSHYRSISALLSSQHRPDAAFICTPNSTHVALAMELMSAGVHVLVEKPISTSIPQGLTLIEAAKSANMPLLVGHHRRFNPYLLAAKRAIDSHSLGRVIALQGSWCLKKPSAYFNGTGAWRRDGDSGGVVWINLIHEIDLLQYLLGSIVLVSALETAKTRGFDAEEGAAIMLRFHSGVVGTFILSDAVPSPWAFEVGTGENPLIPQVETKEGAGGFYRIMGTEASLSVPDLTRWSYDGRKESGWSEVLRREALGVEKEQIPFDLQMQHFINVVRNGEQPNCSGEEALRAMVVCEAVKRSMASGVAMEIDCFEIRERQRHLPNGTA